MTNGSTNAEKAKWKSMRATPRKMTAAELHQRAVARQDAQRRSEKFGLEMRNAAIEGDKARRAKARRELRRLYELGIERNRALGIDPVHRGVCDRGSAMHKAWLAKVKAWDAANVVPDKLAA